MEWPPVRQRLREQRRARRTLRPGWPPVRPTQPARNEVGSAATRSTDPSMLCGGPDDFKKVAPPSWAKSGHRIPARSRDRRATTGSAGRGSEDRAARSGSAIRPPCRLLVLPRERVVRGQRRRTRSTKPRPGPTASSGVSAESRLGVAVQRRLHQPLAHVRQQLWRGDAAGLRHRGDDRRRRFDGAGELRRCAGLLRERAHADQLQRRGRNPRAWERSASGGGASASSPASARSSSRSPRRDRVPEHGPKIPHPRVDEHCSRSPAPESGGTLAGRVGHSPGESAERVGGEGRCLRGHACGPPAPCQDEPSPFARLVRSGLSLRRTVSSRT